MSHASASWSSRGGFVLAFVVLMLFSISVAAVTGYLVVRSEFSMSNHAKEGAEAIAVAHGGLQRFVADQIGVVSDSASYAIGGGIATVTTRKVMEEDSLNHLYYVRSEASVADVLTPDAAARRVVGAFAWHRLKPLAHHAAVMISSNSIDVGYGGEIDSDDWSAYHDCQGGGADPITGAIAKDAVDGDIHGHPDGEEWNGGFDEMYDSLALRWDVLQDPTFAFEFDGWPPDFSSLPADSFPLVRYQGDLSPGSSWSGRGVLVVTGMFDPSPSFQWDGIVLSGSVDDIVEGHIDGMFVGGLDQSNTYGDIDFRMDVHYYSCYVYAANRALSYMELVDNTVFEAY